MFEEQDEYQAAINFFREIITPDDVLEVKSLLSRIQRAPVPAKQYLQRHCSDAKELEEFFSENEHLFFMENKRVTLYDDELPRAVEKAWKYFQLKLETYHSPVHFLALKTKHLENAPESVIHFITRFYPGKEFKRFLKKRPDIFVIYKNHTVFLIEVESVAFFEKRLTACQGQKLNFTRFRGHIGQAPPHVQDYMNIHYLGDDFQDFLRKNSDVFILDDNGDVSLVPFAANPSIQSRRHSKR